MVSYTRLSVEALRPAPIFSLTAFDVFECSWTLWSRIRKAHSQRTFLPSPLQPAVVQSPGQLDPFTDLPASQCVLSRGRNVGCSLQEQSLVRPDWEWDEIAPL